MNHDVFISYSKEDAARIRPLRRALDAAGIKYWIDDRIDGSANFLAEIPEAISHCSIVLFVASEDSARSAWTQKELLYAQKHKKDIFPYKLDNNFKFENCAELDFFFTNIQWKESVDDVVAGLSKKLGISKTSHKATQNIVEDSPEKFSHKSVEPAQNTKPSVKPTLDKVKQYWWVMLCVLAVGCAMWYISADEVEQLESLDVTTTSTPKVEQKSAQTTQSKKEDRIDSEIVCFEENGKYGFKLKTTGEIVIPLKYDYAFPFTEGLAKVKLNGKWGFIDKTDKEVIPLKYDHAFDFSEGLARVILNGKFGFIDKTGKEVIPLKYDDAWSFSEGLAWVKLNGKYGYIDKTDKEVIPLKYDVAWSFSEGLAKVELNGKWGFIDKTGKEVIPLKYYWASDSFREGLAWVQLNGKYGYIDKTGKEVIPLKYDDAWSFSEGLARVRQNGKRGYIDKTGKEVIPLKYDEAHSFNGGLAWVQLNGETFYIDKNGNRVEE